MKDWKLVLAGCSGFIGNALQQYLAQHDVDFVRLVRCEPRSEKEIYWNPAQGEIEHQQFSDATHVINFSGAPIADAVWTKKRKKILLESRITTTSLLVEAINKSENPSCTLLNASGVGYYGDCANECTEQSEPGSDFLAGVCQAWEAELKNLGDQHRTIALRIGVVLGKGGGAMARMLPPMQFGLGGHLGNGRQWMSWISLRDCIAAIIHCAGHVEISGAVNVVNPQPITNHDFFKCLAATMQKPFWAHVPAWILRLRFGQMAKEMLLSSNRVKPDVLSDTGFSYTDLELRSCFEHILGDLNA